MHIPVLKEEVIRYLNIKSNENFVDCTLGEAGHTKEILKKNGPKGRVIGMDWDEDMIERAKKKLSPEFEKRVIFKNKSFAHLKETVKEEGLRPVSGVLFDLGMSTTHIKESRRGFTFQKDQPLVMRYDKKGEKRITAGDIVNKWPKIKIEEILERYGEERFASEIAEEIVRARQKKRIESTKELVEIIKKAKPKRGRIHPATKTFQALRITVNQELENLKEALPQAVEMLKPGGRLVVISFHSLEDRIVKNFFKKEKGKKLKVLTKKPVRADKKEVTKNPSSRSARLRAAEKI